MWPFLIAGGLSALGTALKMGAAGEAADAALSIADRNARQYQDAAQEAMRRAQLQEMQVQAKGDTVVATQRVETSSGGVDVNTGSSADIEQQTKQYTALDRETVRRNAALDAYGLLEKAQVTRQEGAYAAAAYRNDELGALVGGIGSIAGMIGPRILDQKGQSSPILDQKGKS